MLKQKKPADRKWSLFPIIAMLLMCLALWDLLVLVPRRLVDAGSGGVGKPQTDLNGRQGGAVGSPSETRLASTENNPQDRWRLSI